MSDCEMPTYRVGDAFEVIVALVDDQDPPQPLDLDPADLWAQVYDKPNGTELAELDVSAADIDGSALPVGSYRLSGTADASEWPKKVFTNIFDASDKSSSDGIWISVIGQGSREKVVEEPEEPGEPGPL